MFEKIEFDEYILIWLIQNRTRINNRQEVAVHAKTSKTRRIEFFRRTFCFREK